jgi:hypothetical protein
MRVLFAYLVSGVSVLIAVWVAWSAVRAEAPPQPADGPEYTDLYLVTLPDGTRCVVAERASNSALACDFPHLEPK